MTGVNQISLILLALDKALVDNADKLKPSESKALLLATFKTIVGAPVPVEKIADKNRKEAHSDVQSA